MTSKLSPGTPAGGLLDRLRAAALFVVLAGAAGSVGLMLRAGRSTPRLLLVGFVFWILSPFAVLAWTNVASKRWSALTRAALYALTLVLTLASLAFYAEIVLPPAGRPRAFVFVIVPPASWLLIAIVVPLAALLSRKRPRRNGAA